LGNIRTIIPKIIEIKQEYNEYKDDFINNFLWKSNIQKEDGVKLFSFIEKQNVLLNVIFIQFLLNKF